MKLDFSSLRQAIASLEKAAERSLKTPADEEIRDAVIQRFEYTYELCWKMLKRQIEKEAAHPAEIDQLAFRDLLRDARERGMLADITPWIEYRSQRNITAHTYDPKKAQNVYQTALRFLEDAKKLLAALEKRP